MYRSFRLNATTRKLCSRISKFLRTEFQQMINLSQQEISFDGKGKQIIWSHVRGGHTKPVSFIYNQSNQKISGMIQSCSASLHCHQRKGLQNEETMYLSSSSLFLTIAREQCVEILWIGKNLEGPPGKVQFFFTTISGLSPLQMVSSEFVYQVTQAKQYFLYSPSNNRECMK